MYATRYFEAKILNTFNNITATGHGELFVALFHSNPTDTGTAGTEVQYTGYARQRITFTAPYAESGGIGVRNTDILLWASAPSDIGQARFIGVYDSATLNTGNMLLYGELSIPLNIHEGNEPSILQGDILYFITGFSMSFNTRVMNVLRGTNLNGFIPYLALYDGDPETAGAELTGASYARPSLSFGAPVPQVGGQTQIANTNRAGFPSPTTTWGLWAWTGIRNGPTMGELILKFPKPNPEVLQPNYVPHIPAGECKVSLH